MNAHCELFNRTVQDEVASYHEDLPFTDLLAFNLKLLAWIDWYNCERPHLSLTEPVPKRKALNFFSTTIPNQTPPVQYVLARYINLTHTLRLL